MHPSYNEGNSFPPDPMIRRAISSEPIDGGSMKTMELISWNVNGLRAVHKKDFLNWMLRRSPDVLCIQETKASEDQLPGDLRSVAGYHSYFSSAKKGYSGVAIYAKTKPERVKSSWGEGRFDGEGRTLCADFGAFVLFNIYFPNGKASPERLRFKMEFYESFLRHMKTLDRKGKGIIVCGDVNTAHREIDLARPKENEKVSGFLPDERAWIDRFLASGFTDTFRTFETGAGHYTWWDLKSGARTRNVGWRIDYFFVNKALKPLVRSASILKDVVGSDHCPIRLVLELP
jgi:exodeoxyribonuclease-3